MTAIALTIAGSDSGGGAGIQADLKTFSALGVYGATVITALTAQNTRGVTAMHDVPADFIAAQIDAVFSDLAVDAVKIGMLSQPAAIAAVADGARTPSRATNVVLDPVMVAGVRRRLLAPEAIEVAAQGDSIPKAHAAHAEPAGSRGAARSAAGAEDEARCASRRERLLALGAKAVLIKGGHGGGAGERRPADRRRTATCASPPRIATQQHPRHRLHAVRGDRRGPGERPCARRRGACRESLRHGGDQGRGRPAIGHGMGPLHHFHAQWKRKYSPSMPGPWRMGSPGFWSQTA